LPYRHRTAYLATRCGSKAWMTMCCRLRITSCARQAHSNQLVLLLARSSS
jgi:hypothetical protein